MSNNKCGKCGKTVYKAEEKKFDHPKDGVLYFHGLCFGQWKKQYDQDFLNQKHAEYSKKPDVAPAYYRAYDPSTGQSSHMETSGRDKN